MSISILFFHILITQAPAVTPIENSEGQDITLDSNRDESSSSESGTFESGWDISVEETTTSSIINGNSATIADYPMTGGMLMRGIIFGQEFDTFVCTSTLIAPDVVLLAAHCLDDYSFTFGYGEIEDKELFWTRQADLTSWDGTQRNPELPADTIGVAGYVIHDDFSMENFEVGISQNNDIALLFLETPITDIQHAFLPNEKIQAQITEGMEVDVVGWGQQIATSQFESPPSGSYGIKQIGSSYISELGTFEFQVGREESDVRKCHGDSGGPSFATFENEIRVIGVTSHAYDLSDCFETGGVDTRTDAYLNWIESNMIAYCDNGTRTWCEVSGIITPSFYADDTASEEKKRRLFGCSITSQTPSTLWLCISLGLLVFGRYRRDEAKSNNASHSLEI